MVQMLEFSDFKAAIITWDKGKHPWDEWNCRISQQSGIFFNGNFRTEKIIWSFKKLLDGSNS